MNTKTVRSSSTHFHATQSTRIVLPSSQAFSPFIGVLWREIAAIAMLLFYLLAAPRSFAQISGPQKVASSGSLSAYYTWDYWDSSTRADFYSYSSSGSDFSLAILENGSVFDSIYQYDNGSGQLSWSGNYIGYYDTNSQRFTNPDGTPSGTCAVDGGNNFISDSGITVYAAYSVGFSGLYCWDDNTTKGYNYYYYIPESGAYVFKTIGVPSGTFQIMASHYSPPLSYAGGDSYYSNNGDGWSGPSFLIGSPPTSIYIDGGICTSTSVSSGGWAGAYSDTVYYSDGVRSAGIYRYVYPGGAIGSVWGYTDQGYVYGSLDSYSLLVTDNGGGPAAQIFSFAAPVGQHSQGPAAVYWDGVTVAFTYGNSGGADVYWDSSSGKTVYIWPANGSGQCPVSAYSTNSNSPVWTGIYNVATGSFGSGSPLLAIDGSGNLLGVPAGVVAFFGADPAQWGTPYLYSADGSYATPAYSWRTLGGAWAVKFIGIPIRPFIVSSGYLGTSPIYRWSGSSGGDLIVSTSGNGWSSSNIHPELFYVNGVAVTKDSSSEYINPDGGSATYHSSDWSRNVTLNWSLGGWITNWNGGLTYLDNTGFTGDGAWDGGNSFSVSFSDPRIVISVFPPPIAPRYGPAKVVWNGHVLTFDPMASFMSGGDDVYRDASGNAFVQINSGGGVYAWNNTTGVSGNGSYNSQTQAFVMPTYFPGIIYAQGANQAPPNDLVLTGSLDIQGSILNFGIDAANPNKPAFAWLEENGPIASGGPSGDHLRWLTANSLYEWTWEAPDNGSRFTSAPLMALRSSPFPTLALTIPITSPGGPLVLGPYNDTSIDNTTGTNRTQGVLVIGTGTKDPTTNVVTPRNAMRVLPDGTILIQKSGDLLMGNYTAGQRP